MKDFKDTEGKNHKYQRIFKGFMGPKTCGRERFQRKNGENQRIFKNRRIIIWYFQKFKIPSRKNFPKFRNKDQTDFSKNALQMVN